MNVILLPLFGLYDIVFAHIARKEEFDFFLALTKVMKGMGYAVASIPPILKDLRDRISQRAFDFILGGVFRVEEDILPADETQASP